MKKHRAEHPTAAWCVEQMWPNPLTCDCDSCWLFWAHLIHLLDTATPTRAEFEKTWEIHPENKLNNRLFDHRFWAVVSLISTHTNTHRHAHTRAVPHICSKLCRRWRKWHLWKFWCAWKGSERSTARRAPKCGSNCEKRCEVIWFLTFQNRSGHKHQQHDSSNTHTESPDES